MGFFVESSGDGEGRVGEKRKVFFRGEEKGLRLASKLGRRKADHAIDVYVAHRPSVRVAVCSVICLCFSSDFCV